MKFHVVSRNDRQKCVAGRHFEFPVKILTCTLF